MLVVDCTLVPVILQSHQLLMTFYTVIGKSHNFILLLLLANHCVC